MKTLGKNIAIALIATGSFYLTQQAFAAQVIAGKVISAVGHVYLVSNGNSQIALKRSSIIHVGDTIATDENSYTQIKTNDGTIVDLEPKTKYKIAEYTYSKTSDNKGHFVGNLITGGLMTLSGRLAENNPDGIKVVTPIAAISVRGTFLSVRGVIPASQNNNPNAKIEAVFLTGHGMAKLNNGQTYLFSIGKNSNSVQINGKGIFLPFDKSTALFSSVPTAPVGQTSSQSGKKGVMAISRELSSKHTKTNAFSGNHIVNNTNDFISWEVVKTIHKPHPHPEVGGDVLTNYNNY